MVVGTAVVLVGTVVGAIVEAGAVVVVVVPRPCGNWSVPAGGGVSVTPVSEYTSRELSRVLGLGGQDGRHICVPELGGIVPP